MEHNLKIHLLLDKYLKKFEKYSGTYGDEICLHMVIPKTNLKQDKLSRLLENNNLPCDKIKITKTKRVYYGVLPKETAESYRLKVYTCFCDPQKEHIKLDTFSENRETKTVNDLFKILKQYIDFSDKERNALDFLDH